MTLAAFHGVQGRGHPVPLGRGCRPAAGRQPPTLFFPRTHMMAVQPAVADPADFSPPTPCVVGSVLSPRPVLGVGIADCLGSLIGLAIFKIPAQGRVPDQWRWPSSTPQAPPWLSRSPRPSFESDQKTGRRSRGGGFGWVVLRSGPDPWSTIGRGAGIEKLTSQV